MVHRRVVAALLEIKICLRGIWDEGANAKELVLGTPEIIKPDIRVSILIKHSRKVSFALETPVKVCRGQCRGAEFDETKLVGGRHLNSEADLGSLFESAKNTAEILASDVNRVPAIAYWCFAV